MPLCTNWRVMEQVDKIGTAVIGVVGVTIGQHGPLTTETVQQRFCCAKRGSGRTDLSDPKFEPSQAASPAGPALASRPSLYIQVKSTTALQRWARRSPNECMHLGPYKKPTRTINSTPRHLELSAWPIRVQPNLSYACIARVRPAGRSAKTHSPCCASPQRRRHLGPLPRGSGKPWTRHSSSPASGAAARLGT